MDYTTERFIVYLNGTEVFRNYSDPSVRTFASFAPAIVALPFEHLRAGPNEITVRFDSAIGWCLGVGKVSFGPEKQLRETYDRKYLLQFLAPQIINGIIAALTLCVFLFWMRRRQERSFFWLAIVGAMWGIRNLHYSVINPLIGPTLMWESAIYSLFGLIVTFFGFTLTVFDVPNRRKWIGFFVAVGFIMMAMRFFLHLYGKSDMLSFLCIIPMTLWLVVICGRALVNRLSLENSVMLAATSTAIIFSFHDFGWLANVWVGAGFQIQPFASIIVYSAFLYTIGRRFLNALGDVENMNVILEGRVADAGNRLLESEAIRRSLEVNLAVEAERERMMFEIHDRVGANLITALAVAERRGDPPESVATLRGSLLDLKIAVDSLEPLDGDMSLLLASFRHRIERDLHAAGLKFDWQVENVPPLDWMDAVNALHILRIFQEAISNILTHARASVIRIECRAKAQDGASGVEAVVADNGRGFAATEPEAGKGLSSMISRARSLGGMLAYETGVGRGTVLTLWLPLHWPKAANIE